jgi:DNA invertase Pin-like site-specific DNA recombinase
VRLGGCLCEHRTFAAHQGPFPHTGPGRRAYHPWARRRPAGAAVESAGRSGPVGSASDSAASPASDRCLSPANPSPAASSGESLVALAAAKRAEVGTVDNPDMKVAIYSCIGNQVGQDTENQLAQLRRLALSKHPEVYLFVDHQSAKTSERAEFKKLLQSAARHEFQVVLVWSLDRFISGSVAEAFGHIEQLLRYDVQFVSRTEPYFCTNGPARDFIIPIATWILRQERIRISERTKAGLATARRKGKRLGRPWKVLPPQTHSRGA